MTNDISDTIPSAQQDYEDGRLWWEGFEKEQDFNRAAECFLRAAKAGHRGAMRSLSLLYFYAFDDDKRAHYWAARLRETGNSDGAQESQQLIERFNAPALTGVDYYLRLKLGASSYDHVVHSELSCGWRNVINDARANARSLALALNLDPDKAEILAILKGRTQLPFGPAGTEYIKSLAKRDGIIFDEYILCLENIRYIVARPLNLSFRLNSDMLGAIASLYQDRTKNDKNDPHKESRVVANLYEKFCNDFTFSSPDLGDAEREYLDIVWAHYIDFGASGVDLIRRVTSPMDQGEHIVDIRRLGRKTPNGKRIQTYNGQEAPDNYALLIRSEKRKSDITYNHENTYESQSEFPLTLKGSITLGSLNITIVELLSAEGEFAGAVMDVLCPTDARSTVVDEQRETLLLEDVKQFSYGGGNDDIDISVSYIVSIVTR